MMGRPVPTSADPGVRPILLAEEQRNPLLRVIPWTVACVATLAIHGGLFWYLTQERAPKDLPASDEPAAVMVDMAPEVQQAFNQQDQAVGKPMEQSAEQPPPPDEAKPDPTPPVEDSPTEAVAPLPPKPPKPPEKPKEKPPEKKPPPKPVQPIKKQVAKTTGGPRSDQHAERTTASSAGAASGESVADWKSQVSAAINRTKRPQSQSGIVTLHMSIGPSGSVGSVSVVGSSGSETLDSAATEAVYRASPLPPPPPGTSSLTFRMNFHQR